MAKVLSATAIQALKEALCNIFWYKSDLKGFLLNCIMDRKVFEGINWDNYKRQIVADVIDELCNDQENRIGDIRRLLSEVCKMDNFRHLEQLDDGKKKATLAKDAVKALKALVETHDQNVKDDEEIVKRRREALLKLQSSAAVMQKLEEIKSVYFQLIISKDPQKRGFELEKVLYELFSLFDLDPKASFRVLGEQIDGAFELDGTDYLFEAKWTTQMINSEDIDAFKGKIGRKLDNTLGLFLSINGFSDDAVRVHSSGRSTVLLMDGTDLMTVLEGRIDFVSMLTRKRRCAAQTGNIYLKIVGEL